MEVLSPAGKSYRVIPTTKINGFPAWMLTRTSLANHRHRQAQIAAFTLHPTKLKAKEEVSNGLYSPNLAINLKTADNMNINPGSEKLVGGMPVSKVVSQFSNVVSTLTVVSVTVKLASKLG